MIFVDSNIPMYVVGSEHPNKHLALRLLSAAASAEERLVTSAEVLQEILHRYVALDRRDAISPAFDVLLAVVDEVFPISLAEVERAREMVTEAPTRLSARDALHVAVMEAHGITQIMTLDRGFDDQAGIERLGDP
jgi:predicted nucleic acid-binding protein